MHQNAALLTSLPYVNDINIGRVKSALDFATYDERRYRTL